MITNVRDNAPFGFTCEVRMPVTGLRDRSDRTIFIKTGWHLRHADDLVEFNDPEREFLDNIVPVPADQLVLQQRWPS